MVVWAFAMSGKELRFFFFLFTASLFIGCYKKKAPFTNLLNNPVINYVPIIYGRRLEMYCLSKIKVVWQCGMKVEDNPKIICINYLFFNYAWP